MNQLNSKRCVLTFSIFLYCLLNLADISSAHAQNIIATAQTGAPSHLSTQTGAKSDDDHSVKAYLKSYLTDTTYLLTAPSRWDKYDWLTASLVVGTAAGLYAFDQNIHDWAQKRRGHTTDDITRFVKPFGKGQYTIPALGLVYLYGYKADDDRAKTTGLLGIESLLISGAFVQVLKYGTHRYRPEDRPRYDQWDGPSFSSSNLSFPSGDASDAFSVATVIASEYEDTRWVPPLAYGLATLTALGRINDNAHWASDVFVGSAIGYFTAKTIVGLHKKKSRFLVLPEVGRNEAGVLISYKF